MAGETNLETKYSHVKVHNEIEFCEVSDLSVKSKIEKALLANRISYYIKWEKPFFFSPRKNEVCVFCINSGQIELAEQALSELGNEVDAKVKFSMKKVEKTLF